jgi:arsenate reductase (glutaredoxin)
MSVTIIHNPRCSKSRQTLQLLNDNGVEPIIIEYLKTPPSVKELSEIISKLGLPVRDVMRKKEPEYKEVGADNASLSELELITLIHQTPKLLERPIVINGEKAAIGRPPENVLGII